MYGKRWKWSSVITKVKSKVIKYCLLVTQLLTGSGLHIVAVDWFAEPEADDMGVKLCSAGGAADAWCPQAVEEEKKWFTDTIETSWKTCILILVAVNCGTVVQRVRHLGLRSVGRGFKSCLRQHCVTTLSKLLHLCASVTEQYNLVQAKGQWCCAAGEVTAGLAESNGSLPPGEWLTVTCRLTACTPGSAPGPTLGVEYGKPLPLPFLAVNSWHKSVSSLLEQWWWKQRESLQNKASLLPSKPKLQLPLPISRPVCVQFVAEVF